MSQQRFTWEKMITIRDPNRDHFRPPDDVSAASPDGGFAAVDELITSRASSAAEADRTPTERETADGHRSSVSPLPEGPVPIGSLVFADELPDGVVVADEVGRIVVFNRVAARLTGLDPAEVIGKFVFDVLPPRTRHPERSLYLSDGTEVLVSVGYVREGRAGQAARKPATAATGTTGKGTASKQVSSGRPDA